MRNKYMLIGVGIVVGVLLTTVAVVLAGTNFDSPSAPTDSASQMYTLEQVYDRANNGTVATKMTTFDEPDSGPAATMYDLNALYTLVSERSRPPETGQTTQYAAGDDGNLQKGVSWPSPRFTDNANGTVTDNLTGLIWLKDAECYGTRSWANALSDANALANGTCSLSDGSSAGDWRLPNVREMQSLAHYGCAYPALPDTAGTSCGSGPFTDVQLDYYWSSTTLAGDTGYAWGVDWDDGIVNWAVKTNAHYVWPVRGGQ